MANIDAASQAAKVGRLPLNLIPRHYDLWYKRIDLVQFVFEGTVKIGCEANPDLADAPLAFITLNAVDLQLIKAQVEVVRPKSGGPPVVLTASEFRYDLKDQRCEIHLREPALLEHSQEVTLEIHFMGTLNNQMLGFYRSTYQGLDGVARTMATTQFEAANARRAFPCFDEPALKATFRLSATIPAHLQAISNTPVAAIHTNSDNTDMPTKLVCFQKTPKMSTYLAALVVGCFDCISQTSRSVVTTVYTVPGKARQGQFCLDVAVQCLDLYQDLFGLAYPLTKSDLLAIPDFFAGAMENWGCMTYREAKILVQPQATSDTMKRGIARTVCHELAHQWFGNLVTPEFWTQLYLKEGVARFMEFVGIDDIFPEWDAWTEFVQSVYGMALTLDSLKSSHPVEVEVHRPQEIGEIFDAISYAKGASIIRMVASYIGMETFFKGMRLYLERYAYGNAVTTDFWGALQEASGLPIIDLMAAWTSETGYPILIVSDDGQIKIERFLAGGPESDAAKPWLIPVTVRVEGSDKILGPWIVCDADKASFDELTTIIKDCIRSSRWFKLNELLSSCIL